MRFINILTILVGLSQAAHAQTDSLIIKGKISNLNGRLYRQASAITFSRNNILQPQLELSKRADLQADGSFRISLPMLYPQEEIYLDYAGKAYSSFLGSPGEIEINFDGDSLGTTKRLFYFAGQNAGANNQNYAFQNEENNKLKANNTLGAKFYESFWMKSPSEAQDVALKRSDLRMTSFINLGSTGAIDPNLKSWKSAVIQDEMIQNLYEYALSNDFKIGQDLIDSLSRLGKSPLTSQRVTWASRFGEYADRQWAEKKATTPSRTNSLTVKRMATLIQQYSPKLTSEEKLFLTQIEAKGTAEKTELEVLNRLYARNEMVLNLVFDFERESRTYSENYKGVALDFLKARYLPKNFYKYTYRQQLLLNKHIKSTLENKMFQQSLDEIVGIEVKDSVDINKIIAFKDVRANPTEVLPGYFITASNERGNTWFNRILDLYKGKTVYLTKWNFEDERSREEMEFMAALQNQVPEDVVFLYVHILTDDAIIDGELVKQYMVRQRLKGTHMFVSTEQAMDLLFRLNPIEPATFAIIQRNGKFFDKNAPGPSGLRRTAQSIWDARSK